VRAAIDSHADLIAEELNVKAVQTSADEASLAHLGVKPNFRALGPRFGSRMKEAADAIVSLDLGTIDTLVGGGSIEVLGQLVTLDDVIVTRQAREGIAVATGTEFSVAIDTALTDELVVEGIAREIVKAVQGLRREAGLEVTDRIAIHWDSDHPNVRRAMEAHGVWVASETLATDVVRDDSGSPASLGDEVAISLAVTRRQ
jgi:isoleucyl-tRNA synthetase